MGLHFMNALSKDSVVVLPCKPLMTHSQSIKGLLLLRDWERMLKLLRKPVAIAFIVIQHDFSLEEHFIIQVQKQFKSLFHLWFVLSFDTPCLLGMVWKYTSLNNY